MNSSTLTDPAEVRQCPAVSSQPPETSQPVHPMFMMRPTAGSLEGTRLSVRTQDRSPTHIADHDHVVPPTLLLRRGPMLDAFTAELDDLKARADAKRAFVEREDPSPGEDDSD